MKSFVAADRWAVPRFAGIIPGQRARSICMRSLPNAPALRQGLCAGTTDISAAGGTTVLKIYGVRVDPRRGKGMKGIDYEGPRPAVITFFY